MPKDPAARPNQPTLVRIAQGLLFGFAAQVVLGHAIAFGLDGPLFAWHQDRVAIASLNWVIVDTAISSAHGVWINVGFNAVALTLTAVPLALMIPWLRSNPGSSSRARS
jgi:hypothetical protein